VYLSLPTIGGALLRLVLSRSDQAFVLDLAFYFGGLAVLSLIGFGLLRWRWSSGDQATVVDAPPDAAQLRAA
jgi:hypothetical protein